MTPAFLVPTYYFFSFFFLGLWGWYAAPFVVVLLNLFSMVAIFRVRAGRWSFGDLRLAPKWSDAVWPGILLLLPGLAYLVYWGSSELPFSGDYDFHVLAQRGIDRAIGESGYWYLIGAIVASFACWGPVRRWKYAAICAFIVSFFILKDRVGQQAIFARYPAASYFIRALFEACVSLLGAENPLLSSRIANWSAIAFWYFLLRPVFIQRRLSLTGFLLALFFFFQKDVSYYFTSTYLEPWALVFLIVAIEASCTADELFVATFCVGLAAWFKEQSILFLPLVWLVLSIRGVRPKKSDLLSAIVILTPFFNYYYFRKLSGVWRMFSVDTAEHLFDPRRLGEVLFRIQTQFGPEGLCFMVALIAIAAASLWKDRRRRELMLLAIVGLHSVAIFLFHYVDAVGAAWTGYPRFTLFSLISIWYLVLAAPDLDTYLSGRRWKVLCVLALAGSAFFRSGLRFFEGPAAFNYFEHYDAPVFLPFRSAFKVVGTLPKDASALVVSRLGASSRTAAEAYYPELFEGYQIRFFEGSAKPESCACDKPRQVVIVFGLAQENLNDKGTNRQVEKAFQDECLAHLEKSCERTFRETGELPYLIGYPGADFHGGN